jgi:uncharacterized protein
LLAIDEEALPSRHMREGWDKAATVNVRNDPAVNAATAVSAAADWRFIPSFGDAAAGHARQGPGACAGPVRAPLARAPLARALLAVGLCLVADAGTAGQAADGTGRVALANPAAVHCAQQGGETVILNGPGGQIGYCRFPDGRVCEEWALLRDQRCKSPES